jgi:hypothetical protein
MALDQPVLLCSLVSDDVGSIIKIHSSFKVWARANRNPTTRATLHFQVLKDAPSDNAVGDALVVVMEVRGAGY